MNKRKQLIIGGLAVLLCLLGIGGWHMLEKQRLQERMIEEVRSAEVKREIELGLKNLDSNALTEKGIIKSYEIDEASIQHNPMGGIMVTTYINGDKYLYIQDTINKNYVTDKIEIGGSVISAKLSQLLEGE